MIREAEFTKGRIGPPLNRQMGLAHEMGKMITVTLWLCQNSY